MSQIPAMSLRFVWELDYKVGVMTSGHGDVTGGRHFMCLRQLNSPLKLSRA